MNRRIILPATIACFLISMLFSYGNLTGFIVMNVSKQTASIAGVGFFMLGLIFSFFLLNRKK